MKVIYTLWLRNIRKNKIQFFTIMAIIFLSVSFLIGLLSTSAIIKEDVEEYLKSSKLYDIKLISYRGFTEDDMEKIRSIKHVDDIDKFKEEDLWLEKEDKSIVEGRAIYLKSFNKNRFKLVSGRFPREKDEAIIVVGNDYISDSNLNETIKLKKEKNGSFDTLKIVGVAENPLLISSRGEPTNIGSGTLNTIIYTFEQENRGFEALNIYLDIDDKKVLNEEYETVISEIDKKIDKIDQERIDNLTIQEKAINPHSLLKWTRNKATELNGISSFTNDIDKVEAIAKVFPLFFFIVAFLVVTTSMTKVVEDNRKEIGTLRSMGYSKKGIYIFYCLYASLIGIIASLVAVPLGFEVFPKVIGKAYSIGYNLPEIKTKYLPEVFIPVVFISILLVLVTVIIVTRSILKEKPAELFLYKETKNIVDKKIFLERISFLWNHISFRTKVNLRNIFLYKKRMLMTIIGISGCFALVLTSFGLKDSISNIVENQYNKVYEYDIRVSIAKENKEFDEKYKIDDSLEIANVDATVVKTGNKIDTEKATISVIDEGDSIDGFINLYDEDGNKTALSSKGIFVSQKLAELYNLKKGDDLKVEINDENYNFKIEGFFLHYVGHQIIVRDNYYEKITDFKPKHNISYVNFKEDVKDEEINEIIEQMMEEKDILHVISTSYIKKTFADSIDNLDYIIIVMNICAGLLSFVILYNLANINITERIKELSTLKVLGFLPNEVRRYIFREINWLSFMGIVVGIPLGIILHRFVVLKTEVGGMMLDRNIMLYSYIISFIVILLFVLVTNLFLRRKVDRINMVEAMKAND